MEKKDNTIKFDILTGVISAGISFFILSQFDFYIAFILIAPITFAAGLIRGGKGTEKIFLRAMLLNLLFFLLLMAVMNGMLHLLLLLIMVLCSAYLGLYTRQKFANAKSAVSGIIALFAVVVFLTGNYVSRNLFDAMMWKKSNEIAPDYELVSVAGDTIRSSEMKDKIVILDFWATWCGPCKKQYPAYEEVYSKYKENDRIIFLSVNSYLGGDTYDLATRYIEENSFEVPVAFDTKGEAAKDFNVYSIPSLIIIDNKGVIRHIHRGYDESEHFTAEFSKRLDALIAEKQTTDTVKHLTIDF